MKNNKTINIMTTVNAPVEKVWKCWTEPEHIKKWSYASEDWHTPTAENDLRVGGKFINRMEAKDGSMGFDFWGIYDEVKPHEVLAYTLGDERKVQITFMDHGDNTEINETFEAEDTNSIEMQKNGWQAILDNFKRYTESQV
ncbi:SRPBCC family protein [Clostridium sp. YIM B02505]|uniref:SRPBCC family protein n=1 Tax=Clostridium yunnanense TaxID=2800325 RepID=A0ABS1ERG4_9CLOT|nr:SRPBCC family protein [Clostridium yunnanense]MBK1811954.1 SRPBCC family protein [Clostridium yunnanense]